MILSSTVILSSTLVAMVRLFLGLVFFGQDECTFLMSAGSHTSRTHGSVHVYITKYLLMHIEPQKRATLFLTPSTCSAISELVDRFQGRALTFVSAKLGRRDS